MIRKNKLHKGVIKASNTKEGYKEIKVEFFKTPGEEPGFLNSLDHFQGVTIAEHFKRPSWKTIDFDLKIDLHVEVHLEREALPALIFSANLEKAKATRNPDTASITYALTFTKAFDSKVDSMLDLMVGTRQRVIVDGGQPIVPNWEFSFEPNELIENDDEVVE